MEIAQMFESTIDYPGKFGPILFVPGCNLKCGFCHNKELASSKLKSIDKEKILQQLKTKSKAGWYDGVCISGGEATLYDDLPEFTEKIKGYGLCIKLDTNGTNPNMLEKLLSEDLIDYVAMDIKSRKELYPILTDSKKDYIPQIEKSMKILTSSGIDYEFRTTVVPVFYDETNVMWGDIKDYENMAKWIIETTRKSNHKLYLQKFVARGKNEMFDEKFSKENLPDNFHETPDSVLNGILELIKDYLPNCEIR